MKRATRVYHSLNKKKSNMEEGSEQGIFPFEDSSEESSEDCCETVSATGSPNSPSVVGQSAVALSYNERGEADFGPHDPFTQAWNSFTENGELLISPTSSSYNEGFGSPDPFRQESSSVGVGGSPQSPQPSALPPKENVPPNVPRNLSFTRDGQEAPLKKDIPLQKDIERFLLRKLENTEEMLFLIEDVIEKGPISNIATILSQKLQDYKKNPTLFTRELFFMQFKEACQSINWGVSYPKLYKSFLKDRCMQNFCWELRNSTRLPLKPR